MDGTELTIPWRRRTDLVAQSLRHGWVLKDPVAQRYFQLGREEFFVWNRLTGGVSLAELRREFAQHFAPRTVTLDELRQFLGQLISQGLVWGEAAGADSATARRRESFLAAQRWSTWSNVLAIRFRGIDPDRWLTTLLPWCRWLLSPGAVLLGGLLIASAIGLWLSHFDEFASRLPEEAAQWSVADLGSFALVLAGLKILHELGHGLTCKRFGGEVHELGVMLLVFTPCLYCNVSDAWLLPSRWQRMAISAAGMWVEAVVAALCVWLWWTSEPGWFHAVCLQIVFISGVSTLLFNLNPLLRYDGYFLLSDLCEMPNLQQRSMQELTSRIHRWLGVPSDPRRRAGFPRQRRWLAVYAMASLVYRVTMVLGILWLIYHWLEPQGLKLVAQGIAGLTLVTLALGPAAAMSRAVRQPESPWRRANPVRLMLAAGVIALVLWVPLPARVLAPAIVMPADARAVVATMDGRLVFLADPGAAVRSGDPVARLENLPLTRELERLQGDLRRYQQIADNLRRRRLLDPRAGLQLPATERQLKDLELQLDERRNDAERLTTRAPRDGIFWPVGTRTPERTRDQLDTWSGSPFDAKNQDCWVTAGTQFGWVGPDDQWEAMAYLEQSQINRLEPGLGVTLVADVLPTRPVHGTVSELAAARLASAAPDLARRLKLPEVTDGQGARLVGAWYQLRIPLTSALKPGLAPFSASASIHLAPESLATRLRRWVRETFTLAR